MTIEKELKKLHKKFPAFQIISLTLSNNKEKKSVDELYEELQQLKDKLPVMKEKVNIEELGKEIRRLNEKFPGNKSLAFTIDIDKEKLDEDINMLYQELKSENKQ